MKKTNRTPQIVAGCLALAVAAMNAHSAQTERAFTTATRYNAAGQVTGTIAPDPDGSGVLKYLATRNTYDARGFLVKTESGELSQWLNETYAPQSWDSYATFSVLTRIEFTYDGFGRLLTEAVRGTNGAFESMIQFSYGANNLLQCKAMRMNPNTYGSLPASACSLGPEGSFGPDRITRFGYDSLDQVVTEERAVGVVGAQQTYVFNTYDFRLLRTQADANGNKTEMRYDPYGRVRQRLHPSPTTPGIVNEGDYSEYTYDNNGNLRTERKRSGALVTYNYDANNLMIFKDLSDNTYSADVSYDYDLSGQMLSSRFGSDAGQGETNTYDGFGNQLTRASDIGGTSRVLSYQYDANGNQSRVTYPDGYFFEYGFDGLNRINAVGSSISPTPSSSTTELLSIDYGRDGKRYHTYRPGGANTTYLRDNAQRLDSFTQTFSTPANNLENTFTYNSANQITRLVQSNTQYNFHDVANRTGSYVVNGRNQYTSISGPPAANLGYDSNGNLTSDGPNTYSFDSENRLIATGGSVSSSLSYDTEGRLSGYSTGGTTTQFLYDGDSLVAEYVGGAMTRRYVNGDQIDEPLVQYSGAGVAASDRRFLVADHQGSVIAHANNSGAILATNAYDPYGVPGAANSDRFGFTGQMWLREIGLNYYKARIYNPKLGRFLQTDPIHQQADLNLYAYVENDPLNMSDPEGLQRRRSGVEEVESRRLEIEYEAGREAARLAEELRGIDRTRGGYIGRRMSAQEEVEYYRREIELARERVQEEEMSTFGCAAPWAKNPPRTQRVEGPVFFELRDHAARHGQNYFTTNAYYNAAVRNMQTGRRFQFWHNLQFKNAFITRTGPNSYSLTSASTNGNQIYTHIENVNSNYLNNIGITLPTGF